MGQVFKRGGILPNCCRAVVTTAGDGDNHHPVPQARVQAMVNKSGNLFHKSPRGTCEESPRGDRIEIWKQVEQLGK